jgi:hypothetical protein
MAFSLPWMRSTFYSSAKLDGVNTLGKKGVICLLKRVVVIKVLREPIDATGKYDQPRKQILLRRRARELCRETDPLRPGSKRLSGLRARRRD